MGRQNKETKGKKKTADLTKAREKSLSKEKTAKSEHENAAASEAQAKSAIESVKTKESASKEAVKAIQAATDEEKKQKAAIKSHQAKEKGSKAKLKRLLEKMKDEKKKKAEDAKKARKEAVGKAAERKRKFEEKTNKTVEKTVKEKAAEQRGKKAKKEALWMEQQEKQKAVKEQATKEKKTKADCAAKQEQEQMTVRFTLAQDKKVSLGAGWKNFGNGYEGIRLQKQGNVCVLSGLIRVSDDTIQTGLDKGKKFWHAMMENLIQTGEGAYRKKSNWDILAQVSGACRPSAKIELLANNHVDPAKVSVDKDGTVRWVSGGSAHGWISLSGLAWKIGGALDGSTEGVGISSHKTGKVVYANGWRGQGVSVYKQGHVCFVGGKLVLGRNFQGRAMTLPTVCRPMKSHMFTFAHGKQTFRVDVRTDGAVVPINVPNDMKKEIDLSAIAFSTLKGKKISLKRDKNWKDNKKFPNAEASRMGSLCVLSGSAYNSDVRRGTHSLLKHSGSPAILPKECRPRHRMAFTTVTASGRTQRIDVSEDGTVRWIAGKREKFMNLDGIKFDVRAALVQQYSQALLKVSKCE